MKQFFILLILFASCRSNTCIAQVTKKPTSRLLGIFDGRTPCQELSAQFDQKNGPECTKMKWRFGFYVDPITGQPDKYEMMGLGYNKDTPKIGKWHISKGTKTNPNAIVYQLELGEGKKSMFFQKADENILFFLDQEKNIMVGNNDFSYTLNKTERKSM
ncbi:MAG: hypothetical protein ABIR66_02870 [Saprospiraceae bacterium]